MGKLPDWCTPLVSAERMRAIDAHAIGTLGIPGIELMARAGLAVARAVEAEHAGGPVVIVCGKGNNGGDGLFAARQLREAGLPVAILCTGALADFRGDAQAALAELPGERPYELAFAAGERCERSQAMLDGAELIVDALLGTGTGGAPREAVAQAIAAINHVTGANVLAVDVPSGIDASTGQVAGDAVHAKATVTFQLGKPGLHIAPGKWYAGSVQVADIGIPAAAIFAGMADDVAGKADAGGFGLIDPVAVRQLPQRTRSSTKFSSGHVVIAGASRGLAGAVALAAHAAARAGAGYVSACVPDRLQGQIATMLPPEIMCRACAEEQAALVPAAAETVLELGREGSALALGNGLGRSVPAAELARRLAGQWPGPLVLDADGLNAHAGALELLVDRLQPTVLTPHEGELARLLGCDADQVRSERLSCARRAAERSGALVVLKGDDTLVAQPGGPTLISRGDSPALASAGTGDVLAGVIAALLAAGAEPLLASAAAVWLHARAGRIAAHKLGVSEGVLAGDVIAALPSARARALSLSAGTERSTRERPVDGRTGQL